MSEQDSLTNDDESIKPVSSLRSHFEKIGATPKTSRENSPGTRSDTGRSGVAGRISLDLQRSNDRREVFGTTKEPSQAPLQKPKPQHLRQDSNLKPPALGKRSLSSDGRPSPRPADAASSEPGSAPQSNSVQKQSPQTSYFALPSSSTIQVKSATSSPLPPRRIASPRSPFLHPSELDSPVEHLDKQSLSDTSQISRIKLAPPPVNRMEKPSNIKTQQKGLSTAAFTPLIPNSKGVDKKASPFSTPPSSDDSEKFDSEKHMSDRPQARVGKQEINRVVQPVSATSRRPAPPPPPPMATRPKSTRTIAKPNDTPLSIENEDQVDRPNLPPRRDLAVNQRLVERSKSPTKKIESTSSTPGVKLVAATTSQFLPPPKKKIPTSIPRDTTASPTGRPQAKQSTQNDEYPYQDELSGSDADTLVNQSESMAELPQGRAEFPLRSEINRRPPFLQSKVKQIDCKHDARGTFTVCGEYLCTAGHVVKIWSLKSGAPIVNLSFETEGLKVTSAAFKSAAHIGNEGTQVWLGFNNGDISELDIPSRSITFTKTNVHNRRDVLRIFRSSKSMWSLDERKVAVWPSLENALPDLRQAPDSFSIPEGHTFSMAVGHQLWVGWAVRQDVNLSIYDPAAPDINELASKSLNSLKTGIITSGAVLGSQADKVYLGHLYGDISIHSSADFTCLSVVKVGTHKINSLAGVGKYLWAAFGTGLISVFNITTNPWNVKKEWKAHEQALRLVVDNCSPWKMERFQVASLGSEHFVKLWDGALGDDWIETRLQSLDVEYCQFDEINAMVVSWNAGASKPHDIRYSDKDSNFFRDLVSNRDTPDILVFGFQELVDLERKSTAARSLFHSSKKKDISEQDHMRHQYRDWIEFLDKTIHESISKTDRYILYHTSNLIGLFTCVFIRSAIREIVTNLDAFEVKRGMGGRAGNKGALVTRFFVNDTSICFLNCHLAAGQNQSKQRNADLAAILDYGGLAPERNPSRQMSYFIGGGDGRMILDHEICILNGDLNYRIGSMNRDVALKAIKGFDLPRLLERDQLLQNLKIDPEFRLRAFNEASIDFAPTYKYDVGTDRYDTSSKARIPSWCDRILYTGLGRVKQLDYLRHEVYASDHRPVSASFLLRTKTVSQTRRDAALEKSQSAFENVQARIILQAKTDFLVFTCGLQVNEAKNLLAQNAGD